MIRVKVLLLKYVLITVAMFTSFPLGSLLNFNKLFMHSTAAKRPIFVQMCFAANNNYLMRNCNHAIV